MKKVLCKKCGLKLGEINEKSMSVVFEKGIEPSGLNVAAGMVICPFTCTCGSTQTEVFPVR